MLVLRVKDLEVVRVAKIHQAVTVAISCDAIKGMLSNHVFQTEAAQTNC